jgi:3-oxoacyl-[acyl-carrier protein] reductase
VTGGSRGIGAAIARALAAEGCDVALTHLGDGAAAEAVTASIRAAGRRADVAETDVADFAAAERLVDRLVRDLGRLDVCVCNAGITRDRVVWKMTEEEWDRVLAVNLKGCFNYNRAAARVFKEQGSGRIVNIASINGLRGKFGQANYAASKGGIVALTKTVARDLGRYQVTANAVAPGMVRTEMTKDLPEDFTKQALAESLLGRLADPEDVANLVVFLCSDRARHITGHCLQVDGGQYT